MDILGIGKLLKQIKAGLNFRSAWNKLFKPPKSWRLKMPTGEVVEVEVKSAGSSKINLGAATLLVVGGLQMIGLDISAEMKEALGNAVGIIVQLVVQVVIPFFIIVWRTFFTKKLTPQSAAKVK